MNCRGLPVMGSVTVTSPTDGSDLYEAEENSSQICPLIALVASGLQRLVCIRVLGTRMSFDRKLSSRKSGALTMSRIFDLKSSVFVQAQYFPSTRDSSMRCMRPGARLEVALGIYLSDTVR